MPRPFEDQFKPLTSIAGQDLFALTKPITAEGLDVAYPAGVYFFDCGDWRIIPISDEARELREFHRDARVKAVSLAVDANPALTDIVSTAEQIFTFLTKE